MMKNTPPTIIVTGGHLTPAIAVIEEIQKLHPDYRIEFIGREESFETGGSPSYEAALARETGIAFHPITAGKLSRTWSWATPWSLLKIPIGVIQATRLIGRLRPQVVLTFGGYVAFPVVVAAWIKGIPIITHEQTRGMGLANSIISRIAALVIRARDKGVPIRKALFHPPEHPTFAVPGDRPIVYITGGSTGARSMNDLIFPILPRLLESCVVVHQTGWGDRERALAVARALPANKRSAYVAGDYFHVSDVAWIYAHAKILVGRSGANTVAEASALAVPSLFIPLPWASRGEQDQNAQHLVSLGSALVVRQKDLTPEALLSHISHALRQSDRLKQRAIVVAKHYPRDGALEVARHVVRLVEQTS